MHSSMKDVFCFKSVVDLGNVDLYYDRLYYIRMLLRTPNELCDSVI